MRSPPPRFCRVMAITLPAFEARAIASFEDGIAGVGDEHDRSSQDEDEFVFVSVPMALTGPGARALLQQINAELGEAGGMPESPPSLVLAGFVERLGIARSDARAGLCNIDLHVSTPRSPTSPSVADLHTQRVVRSVLATSPLYSTSGHGCRADIRHDHSDVPGG